MLENFTIAKFKFTIGLLHQTHPPRYKGATYHDSFSYAFKYTTYSVRHKKYGDCLPKAKCVYSTAFGAPTPYYSEMLRLYLKVPHPSIIEPTLTGKKIFDPCEQLTFNLFSFNYHKCHE